MNVKLWDFPLEDLSSDELFEHLMACLKAHDWTYEFSSNADVVSQGKKENAHIQQVKKLCETENQLRTEFMVDKYDFWKNQL